MSGLPLLSDFSNVHIGQLIEARCRDIPRLIPFEYALYVIEGGKGMYYN